MSYSTRLQGQGSRAFRLSHTRTFRFQTPSRLPVQTKGFPAPASDLRHSG